MTSGIFFAAVLLAPLALGLPVTNLVIMSALPRPARIAGAWATGTVVLTLILTILSSLGITWNLFVVAIPAAVALGYWLWRRPLIPQATTVPVSGNHAVAAALCSVGIAAAGLVPFLVGAASSADLAYFWGVKGVLFATDRGMDFQQMNLPHLIHLHPNYPPLWPVLLAWGAMVAGSMPWTAVPLVTWLWVVAAAAILHGLLRPAVGARGAAVITCFWLAIIVGSAARSFSGGSAEGPLVLFLTVAVTALLVEPRTGDRGLRWLAAGSLAGAVLTKSEGMVAVLLLVGGTFVRDHLWGRRRVLKDAALLAAPAAAAAAMWLAVRLAHHLPLADPIREAPLSMDLGLLPEILKVCIRLLISEGLWVAWIFPVLALSGTRLSRPHRALPALFLAAGIPIFALTYYLHAAGNPVELIVWTLPRLIQPAVSAWIIGLGVLAFSNPGRERLAARVRMDEPR